MNSEELDTCLQQILQELELEDASESENENTPKTELNLDTNLLLAALLEEKCSLFVKDTKDAQKLFEELCTHLSEYSILSHQSHSGELSDSRNQQMEILKEIMKTKAQDTMLMTSPDGNENIGLTEKDYAPQNNRYKTEFKEFDKLGKGGFGSVFKVEHKLDGGEYAVKKIRLRPKIKVDTLLREVKTLARMKHKNIVGYNAAWLEDDISDSANSGFSQSSESQETESSGTQDSASERKEGTGGSTVKSELLNKNMILYIQMELCGCNLQDWLSGRNAKYREKGIEIGQTNMRKINTRIFREILHGVHYIHTRANIHRDLKPQNIFLTKGNQVVKIGDFGLAKYLLGEDSLAITSRIEEDAVPINFSKHTKCVGTSTYASPEQLAGPNYTIKSDIYSLGVILFEMYNIFHSTHERFKEIEQLRKENKCSETFKQMFGPEAGIIESLINPVDSDRPLAFDILKHRLFRNQQSGDSRKHRRKKKSTTLET